MNNKYETEDILNAINILLNNKKKEKSLILKQDEIPLKLTNEIKNHKHKIDDVPKDTENIILQAEKYLKK